MSERTVPFNLPAERAVLGALLSGIDLDVVDAASAVSPADFYLEKHAIVNAAIRECQARSVGVSLITVGDVLKRRDELDMIGGMSFLAELVEEGAISPWQTEDHANVITRTAAQRRAIEATGQAQAAIYNYAGENLEQLAEHVLKIVAFPFQRIQAKKRRLWLTEDDIEALPPVGFAIDGVIVNCGVTLIYGPSDSGKTFIVVDMAMRFAQHHRVMYCAGEDAHGIAIRKKAWQQEYQRAANGNFLMWNKRISLLSDADVDLFIEQCLSAQVKMVIIDTLSQFAGGNDENANELMALFIANCERIRRAIDGAVIVVHHTDKGGNNFRGAGALKDNSYGCLSVYKDDDVIVMECIRIKNYRPWIPRRYRLKEVLLPGDIVSCVPLPASQVEPKRDMLSAAQGMILNGACIITKAQGAAKAGDLQRYSRIDDRNFWSSLNRLIKSQYIVRSTERGASGFIPTEAGWAYSKDQYKQAAGNEDSIMFGVTTDAGLDVVEIPRYNEPAGYDVTSETPQEQTVATGATIKLSATAEQLNQLRAEWSRLDKEVDERAANLSEEALIVYNRLQQGLDELLPGTDEYAANVAEFNRLAEQQDELGDVLRLQIEWGEIGRKLQEA